MSNTTPDERPLPLGALAQTESPEIVRAALGRFRRRVLLRGLVLLLAIGAAFVLYPRYFGEPKELAQEIRDARGVILLQKVDGSSVQATIARAARLSHDQVPGKERFGLHVIAITLKSSALDNQLVTLLRPSEKNGVLEVVAGEASFSGFNVWISAAVGTRVIDVPFAAVSRPDGAILDRPLTGTLHLDMQTLNIPDWIWR